MIKIRNILICMLLIVFISLYLDANNQNISNDLSKNNHFKKFEFGILSGFGLPQFNLKNTYSDSHSYNWYDITFIVNKYSEYEINLANSYSVYGKSEGKFTFGGFLNYFFIKNFGLQFMFESANYDFPIETSISADLSLHYYRGGNDNYSASPNIENTKGSLTTIPISFNIITRFFIGANISGHASGGLTYYQASIKAESKVVVGIPFPCYKNSSDLWFLWADSALIPIYLDNSFSEIGGNLGVGFSFQIHENFGIVADFRYFLAPKEKFTWIPMAGNYKYVLFEEYGWSFYSNPFPLNISIAGINILWEENKRFVQVDPSYYRLSLGLKFGF